MRISGTTESPPKHPTRTRPAPLLSGTETSVPTGDRDRDPRGKRKYVHNASFTVRLMYYEVFLLTPNFRAVRISSQAESDALSAVQPGRSPMLHHYLNGNILFSSLQSFLLQPTGKGNSVVLLIKHPGKISSQLPTSTDCRFTWAFLSELLQGQE